MKGKSILTVFVLTVAAMTGLSFYSAAQRVLGGGPGIAVAGSATEKQLPDAARNFLKKHFKNVGIRTCENFYAKGKYEVELTNGVDLEFNTKGEVVEIDAPGNTTLSTGVVKDLLPRKAYERLTKDGVVTNVESIEFRKGKAYEVELNIQGPDTYIFDIMGTFLALED
ncbi:MAG: PepSY-like domain-containing protein [Candidatus Amulumruptor caecigallinarius]|nr:PepSY-like domain-containing protein [Candidatus Amulumruptor caecigallinarius]